MEPEDRVVKLWEIIFIIILLLNFIYVTLKIVFRDEFLHEFDLIVIQLF
jgi:hypothetical protein